MEGARLAAGGRGDGGSLLLGGGKDSQLAGTCSELPAKVRVVGLSGAKAGNHNNVPAGGEFAVHAAESLAQETLDAVTAYRAFVHAAADHETHAGGGVLVIAALGLEDEALTGATDG